MSEFSKDDVHWMRHAIELAQNGRLTTRPNPNVGCVVLDAKGQMVGSGWHHKAGQAHAEVNALAMAKDEAKDGTLYVTLEPCSHYGKTPPCALAIIEAGIKKVICSMSDPNPQVAGKGFKILQEAGIKVSCGLLEDSARALNLGFFQRMQYGRPKVTLKMAQSLDGKIALSNKKSQWITGKSARHDVQKYRALHDAIVTGSGTVIADDPSLNVRKEELGTWSSKEVLQPLRVLVDGRNQITKPLKMFQLAGRTVVINQQHNAFLDTVDIEQVNLSDEAGRVDLVKMFQYLGAQQINSVWVEAGGQLAGALLTQRLVDELVIYQAPKLMGAKALSSFHLQDFDEMNEILDLNIKDIRQVGDDLKIVATPNYN